MKLFNLTEKNTSALRSKGVKRPTFSPIPFSRGTNAQYYFRGSAGVNIIVMAKGDYLGKLGNTLRVLLTRQDGVRYFIALYVNDGSETKLNGTLSTAGGSGGFSATEAGAIVNKINTSAMAEWLTATLVKNDTNVDYTGTDAVNYASSLPMRGGRD